MIFIIANKDFGALHLGLCISDAFLQILCGSAAKEEALIGQCINLSTR
jgi:hypothetical protein